MTHYNLVHKCFPMSQAMIIPNAKAAVLRDNPSMETEESQEQEGVYSRSTKRQKESPLCSIDGACAVLLNMARLRPE